MHLEAHEYVVSKVQFLRALKPYGVDLVVEFGSHDWNGTIRSLFDDWARNYLGLDLVDGPGVDIIGDAAEQTFIVPPDIIVCTELLEHAHNADKIVQNVGEVLTPGGIFIATMAGPGRAPHAHDGSGDPYPDEHYANIDPADLERWLGEASFAWFDVNYIPIPGDTRCFAVR